ncbi:carboxypeptidase-like regulatory domain-containing protein, partial [Hyalangium sp.]|uniref:carboxypeptidase-like regulatory domain-containing protein n=1 Tax=Hyalangium sp. TaxID=2028555 RepID=UPI002D330C32
MKKLLMALVPLLVIGCGGDPEDTNGDGIADGVQEPNNVSVVVPSTPKGTVSGQVLTTQQKPLAGASVAMTIGSATVQPTTTDENGNFSFKDVPGGAQVLLTFSKDGFASLRASSIVPDSAGNVPINNGNASFGPVLLSELNGSVKFNLIGPDGRPAVGARGTLDVNPAGRVLFGLSESTTSRVVVEATSDAGGVISFDRVPTPIELARLNGTYLLSISALDTNGDGIFESGGFVSAYAANTLVQQGTVRTEQLAPAYSPGLNLAVKYSSLGVLSPSNGSSEPQHNMVKSSDSIYIVFNQPVQPSSVVVGLTDEYGKESLSVGKDVAGGGTILTIKPGQPLVDGREYNLYIRAVPAAGGSAFSTFPSISFFGGNPASPPAIAVENVKFQEVSTNNGLIDRLETVYVNFNQVMGSTINTEYAYVYVGLDLNNSGRVGDATGERDPATGRSTGVGFPLVEAEPLEPIQTRTPAEEAVFPLTNSGYTTRFAFTYAPPATPAATYVSLQPGTNLFIHFGKLTPSLDVYESGWGVPQTADV